MIPKEKGDILEKAVEEIERLIINNTSLSKAQSIEIERKKKIYENGIFLHEIDFYITIDFGFQNSHIYIIECKNWDCKSISKTQIIDFQAKIKYVGAAKGFVIAKNYSPAASLIASTDPYIELLKFDSSEFSNIIKAPEIGKFIIDSKEAKISEILLTFENESLELIKPVNCFLEEFVKYNNQVLLCKDWLKEIINQEIHHLRKTNEQKVSSINSGAITLKNTIVITFESNQFFVKNIAIASIEIHYQLDVDVYQTKIISKFDVEKKGRNIHYELMHPEKKGFADFTTIPSLNKKDMWDINLNYKID